MDLQKVVSTFVHQGVTADEFHQFITQCGIESDPFVLDVMNHLLVQETMASSTTTTPSWNEEEASDMLGMLQSPETTNPSNVPLTPGIVMDSSALTSDIRCGAENRGVDFEPWSQEFESAVLEQEDATSAALACLRDGEFKRGKTFYCSRCRARFSGYDAYSSHRKCHTPDDEGEDEDEDEALTPGNQGLDFEPWSPGFECAVLEHEDVTSATLACLRDGEFKRGKTFYCSKCRSRFSGYEAFARHRETHVRPDNMEAGPSGFRNRERSVAPSGSQVGGGETPYRIELSGVRTFARSAATETTYKVKFDDQWQGRRLGDLRQQLNRLFEALIERAREGVADNDLLRVVIRHDALNHAVVVPLQAAGAMNVDKIMSKVEDVLQSEESLSVDASFEVIVGALRIPRGAGRMRITKVVGPGNSIHKKRSMVQIVNDDQLCMARAIGVGLAKQCVVPDEAWERMADERRELTNKDILLKYRQISAFAYKKIKDKSRKEQKYLATALCEKAGIPTHRPGSLNDIPAFETALRVRIAVVASSLGNKFIRVPANDHDDWPLLYLYLVEHNGLSHFHAIINITGFFSARYFCERCFKQYDHDTSHRCESTCITCKSGNCPETDTMMSCLSCHMTCRSLECFQRHALKKRKENDLALSSCDKYWRCTTCKKVVNREKRSENKHHCSEWLCKCCRSWVQDGHRCLLFAEERKKSVAKFIFFDFEASQDQTAQCAAGYSPKKCCQTPCKDCRKCQKCFQSWCGQPMHVPNFVVAQTVCNSCKDEILTPSSTCDQCGTRCSECDTVNPEQKTYAGPPCLRTCGLREIIFQGDDTLQEFGSWLFNSNHKDATVLAHNMKGYDGVFLLEYLVNNSIRPSKVIYNGSKIMYMEVGRGLNMRVCDSLNFLPMKLAALPKAFGLSEQCKGYFPHFFNKREHQHYVGPYPDPEMYGADFMSTGDRTAFIRWHEEKTRSGAVFDFRKEMEQYCRSDVDILRRSCLRFRELMMDTTEVDPFKYVTIASVCMGIYKTRFLEGRYRVTVEYSDGSRDEWVKAKKGPEGWSIRVDRNDWQSLGEDVKVVEIKPVHSPIAQVPSAGYVQRDTFSKASIQWLEYEMELARRKGRSLRITHAGNEGEEIIMGTRYKVDGRAGNTVYEYHGCLWHGCERCYPDNRQTTKHPMTGQSLAELFALTAIKKKVLTEDFKYDYVCIWEHEWLNKVEEDPDVREFLAGLDIQDRLDPRDSFFGGRTNAAKLHYKVQDEERIKYVDFTSLYPYVNKYSRYPVGHPEILTSHFQPLSEYFGIAKVKILAPRGLYHPVLPYRSNGKLKFPLCRTCADKELTNTCGHTEEQRAFVGTWCTPEIETAVSKGYRVLKTYEVYHWDESTQYDPETKQGGLFTSYVNTFLKFKQEASGWPEWCETEEDCQKYVREYFQKEGVQLDPTSIKKNPGLRALAKLCLNSFWGKFGQRLNQGICEFVHESEMDKFYRILSDRTKKVKDFHVINEDHLHLEYEHQSEFVPEDMKTNIFLATFTTCWARLKLYSVLDQLGDRSLYYDTDSVVYISRPGQFDPPLGDYLGQLTDELEAGDYIIEFVSAGPKNYAYSTSKGKRTCKIRGFSLNYTNAQLLNFDSVKGMVLNVRPGQQNTYRKRRMEDDDNPPSKVIVTTNPAKISRAKFDRILYNRQEEKKYRVVYDKRVILESLGTLPYGY